MKSPNKIYQSIECSDVTCGKFEIFRVSRNPSRGFPSISIFYCGLCLNGLCLKNQSALSMPNFCIGKFQKQVESDLMHKSSQLSKLTFAFGQKPDVKAKEERLKKFCLIIVRPKAFLYHKFIFENLIWGFSDFDK